jgi:hypothetical protein
VEQREGRGGSRGSRAAKRHERAKRQVLRAPGWSTHRLNPDSASMDASSQ